MNVAIERQGGVHRLARLGFWGSFVLICPILQSQAFKVYFTPRRWNCLCWRRSTSAAAFLWGNNIQLNTSQKKEGRDGTTWGDDKKKGVVKRRWLSGGTPEVNLFLFIPHPPSTRAFYFALCTPATRGWLVLKEGGKKKKGTGIRYKPAEGWTKPASWESLPRRWRPWARGTRRGERTTSAATLWWVGMKEHT